MIQVSEVVSTALNSPLLHELSNSFSIDIEVSKREIDGFGHVNNANYIQWLDQVHWAHLIHMGISEKAIFTESCGFVTRDTAVRYLAPLVEGDLVRVGTGVIDFDERFRLTRQFQLVRVKDEITVLRGTIHYVAVDLKEGRPKRMPQHFVAAISPYVATVS